MQGEAFFLFSIAKYGNILKLKGEKKKSKFKEHIYLVVDSRAAEGKTDDSLSER